MSLKPTPRKVMLALLLSLFGAGYFGAFSGLEVYAGIKPSLMLIPVQVGVLFYLLWWKRRGK
jgi:hypothetical protein